MYLPPVYLQFLSPPLTHPSPAHDPQGDKLEHKTAPNPACCESFENMPGSIEDVEYGSKDDIINEQTLYCGVSDSAITPTTPTQPSSKPKSALPICTSPVSIHAERRVKP